MKQHVADGITNHGDTETLMRDMYAIHAKALRAYISKRVDGDAYLAEDLAQETFLRALNRFDPASVQVEELRPWLVTVARRLIIDSHRKKAVRPPETSLERIQHDIAGRDETGRITRKIALMQAFETLRPAQRRVLIESYFHDRSSFEAAQILGIPIGTVRSRTFYAIRSLKEALVAMDFTEIPG
ncbi:sigma-70 family RNA polymerase sigma factor [Streptomyces sp. NPDC001139]